MSGSFGMITPVISSSVGCQRPVIASGEKRNPADRDQRYAL
jgi:hypothetical protein